MKISLVLFFLALACFVATSCSGSQSAASSLEQLLQQARQATDRQLIGPFEMTAEVKVLLANGKTAKGTYKLDWAAPDRFRQEIHLPGYDGIKIAAGSSLFVKRNIDFVPLRIFQIEELLDVTGALNQAQSRVERILQRENSARPPRSTPQWRFGVYASGNVNCFGNSPVKNMWILCTDVKSGLPVRVQILPVTGDFFDQYVLYVHYATVGNGNFPRTYRMIEGSVALVQIDVKKIKVKKDFAPGTFMPPQGAQQFVWCANEVPAKRLPLTLPLPASFLPDDFPVPEILYGLVRPDGTLRKFSILQTDGSAADADVRMLAPSIRFSPAKCGNQSVEQEVVFGVDAMDVFAPPANIPNVGEKGYTRPECILCPTPSYTDQAFRTRVQGEVILSVIIGPDGRAHDIQIVQKLGEGLDEISVRTVRDVWRFSPAKGPDGKPAPVRMIIEINFHLVR